MGGQGSLDAGLSRATSAPDPFRRLPGQTPEATQTTLPLASRNATSIA